MYKILVTTVLIPACQPIIDCEADDDGDGVPYCDEVDLGTDPTLADSDNDGDLDAEELACQSDPLDPESVCYECGWIQNDPGTLDHSGDEIGDTIANLRLRDQCRDRVDLWDFAGDYRILFMTATWCNSCIGEAAELRARSTNFTERLGQPLDYLVVLFEDNLGDLPGASEAVSYAETIQAKKKLPVLSSPDGGILAHTPYDGRSLPGKCIVTPEMTLLHCTTGHGDDEDLFDLIQADLGQ